MIRKEFLAPDYPFNQNDLKEINFDDFLNDVTPMNLNQRLDCLTNIIQATNAMIMFGKAYNSDKLDYQFLENTISLAEMVFLGLTAYKKKFVGDELPANVINFRTAVNRKRGRQHGR